MAHQITSQPWQQGMWQRGLMSPVAGDVSSGNARLRCLFACVHAFTYPPQNGTRQLVLSPYVEIAQAAQAAWQQGNQDVTQPGDLTWNSTKQKLKNSRTNTAEKFCAACRCS